MTFAEIAARVRDRVPPRRLVRLIPKPCFVGSLGFEHRLYTCVADYEELQGLSVREAAARLYGGKRHQDQKYGGFANHHWRLAWHFERQGGDSLDFEADSADHFFVVTLTAGQHDALDLFPGTWKAIAYIATDHRRMHPRSDIAERLLEIHRGRLPCDHSDKSQIDFLGYADPGHDEYSQNEQGQFYSYLSYDSAYTNEVLEPFGVSNRCWHGRGYVGAFGDIFARVFLVRNLPLRHDCIVSCELMPRDAVLEAYF